MDAACCVTDADSHQQLDLERMEHRIGEMEDKLEKYADTTEQYYARVKDIADLEVKFKAQLSTLHDKMEQMQKQMEKNVEIAASNTSNSHGENPKAEFNMEALEEDPWKRAVEEEMEVTKQREEKLEVEVQELHGEIEEVMQSRNTFTQIAQDKCVYKFKHSVWDLALVIGIDGHGVMGSIFVSILLLLNMFMQILLCLLINDSFTTPTIDGETIEAMKKWRTYDGHNFDNVNKVSGEPLARRICRGDGSVITSFAVGDTLASIAGYMPSLEDRYNQVPRLGHWLPHIAWIPEGELMCMLALMIWMTNVSVVFAELSKLSRALWYLPKRCTQIVRTNEGGELVSLSQLRKIYMATILTIQFLVAAILAITGVLYLSYTINLSDLILNAAALQIVLDFDDIVYEALAPYQARSVIETLNLFSPPLVHSWKGLDPVPVLLLGSVMVTLSVVSATILAAQSGDLRAARFEICGGNLDFVNVKDRFGVVWATEVYFDGVKESVPDENYAFRAVQQLVKDSTLGSDKVSNVWLGGKLNKSNNAPGTHSLSGSCDSVFGSIWSVDSVFNLDVSLATASWNSNCVDILPQELVCLPSNWSSNCDELFKTMIFAEILQNAADDDEHILGKMSGCDSVVKYCQWDSLIGIRARQICPVTCGCDDPMRPIAIGTKNNGCSPSCMMTDTYKAEDGRRQCQDLDNGSPYWNRWSQSMERLIEGYPPTSSWRAPYNAIRTSVGQDKCAITLKKDRDGDWQNMCELSHYFSLKPLVHACPVSCGCNVTLHPHCPTACRGFNR